jgi:hypothetical protein
VRRSVVAPLVLVALLLFVQGAFAAVPDEDHDKFASLHCVERVALPLVENVMEAKWSPDSNTLAVVWFGRLPSPRSVTGYREQEITDTLDLRTGELRPLGVGDQPEWSASGALVAYWGPDADELRIVRSDRIISSLTPTIPRVRWTGEALRFIEKNEIREWREGSVHTLATLEDRYVPQYPRDDVYFSADGDRFTMTRYSMDGTLVRYLGSTLTGDIEPLDTGIARYIEWSPKGATLLVRFLERIELRDLAAGTSESVSQAGVAGPVHAWAPDGRTLLAGRVSPTVPGGNAFDAFQVWDSKIGASAATLPNLMGERTFSPDGRYFVGVSRTGTQTTRLEVYRCRGTADAARPDPEARFRQERIDASAGRFVRPTSGEITQFLQGSHTGVDVAAPFGSLIAASDDGTVTATGWVAVGGNRVCVLHGGGLESCYYHTSLPLVSIGERVARGQPIALIGMTGLTTGPHTHWEAKLAGRIVDPLAR